MYTEKTKDELRKELEANRAAIEAKKKERKDLIEKEKELKAKAKEAGLTLSESYLRSESIADALSAIPPGAFTLSAFASASDAIYASNGKKSNAKESETVSRLILPAFVRFGIIEKTGKDTYRKPEGKEAKKTA